MSNQQLIFLIEQKRETLLEVAKLHGFASPIVIKCSQELDVLINKLMEDSPKQKETAN
ncbi:aspartyl-phosphate phosphatase Spo0E family protein [Niallia taxi]|mgnify:CR=1 FL=1|uniref:aspartyl-phosphate phosphatase Spo0E family protein n=1 Tax=Niallia taxi TaxID=2499688 RepID=UPI00119FFC4C|nr:aspartyl-phosphate phosphatase Spo0E family protein [Niallia taxi]MCT2343605.1 aspartyl-phosphate phosphatase Spo0E family protein [Niallia taxi]MDE5051816.1 aspartyl-phosphate phosphatase Spo0E family protein [Niallia taxi]MED3963813.1 aspartyl-phosphate phosphatase Spo0E family protein [Niallia taxi]